LFLIFVFFVFIILIIIFIFYYKALLKKMIFFFIYLYTVAILVQTYFALLMGVSYCSKLFYNAENGIVHPLNTNDLELGLRHETETQETPKSKADMSKEKSWWIGCKNRRTSRKQTIVQSFGRELSLKDNHDSPSHYVVKMGF